LRKSKAVEDELTQLIRIGRQVNSLLLVDLVYPGQPARFHSGFLNTESGLWLMTLAMPDSNDMEIRPISAEDAQENLRHLAERVLAARQNASTA
jgi:hypothetical protein